MIYKIKIRHEKTNEDGFSETVTESYLVDACGVIDAEAKLVAMGGFSDYATQSIVKPQVSLVIDGDDERYYRCKIVTEPADEATKPTVTFLIVNACDFDHAVARAKEYAAGSPYAIESVALTNIAGYV